MMRSHGYDEILIINQIKRSAVTVLGAGLFGVMLACSVNSVTRFILCEQIF